MRACLDANIFVSALIRPKGPPGQILKLLLRDRAFELVCFRAILEEIGRALRYPRVRKYLRATDAELEPWFAALEIVAVPVGGALDVHAVAADPDDDKYLAGAVEGMAEFVVTGDAHLLALGTYEAIRLVTARAFLEALRPV